MKRFKTLSVVLVLALFAAGAAHARKDDLDVSRLNGSLDQLSSDPTLGQYAQAEQARARDAINQLSQADRGERAHDLYLAERRVDLARTSAQLAQAQSKLSLLDREHDQILLANSRREAAQAQRELERQRMQYQMAQEETARLQQQGMQYSQAADQARADAERANKLAAAQSRVASSARRQAELASKAARAMRSQMQAQNAADADQGSDTTPSSKPAKSKSKPKPKPKPKPSSGNVD